jgi:hypothetical protein
MELLPDRKGREPEERGGSFDGKIYDFKWRKS